MLTGALAASHYGVPRTTMDIDIVVNFALENTNFLATQLRKAGLRVSERKIEASFKSGFKIITLEDEKTPFTIDVILSDKKLEKRKGSILGIPTYYQTPEALILAKLRMIKATVPKERALKDKDDIKAILKYTKVNLKALKEKASKEKTISVLEELTNLESR
ncbi:MAG: hypothetical protein QMD23_02350 [Candidatus Bathyarchaeia archaeon]|nr:hypothetical protein [Candidatus Bathyarchaeia archaeon]